MESSFSPWYGKGAAAWSGLSRLGLQAMCNNYTLLNNSFFAFCPRRQMCTVINGRSANSVAGVACLVFCNFPGCITTVRPKAYDLAVGGLSGISLR